MRTPVPRGRLIAAGAILTALTISPAVPISPATPAAAGTAGPAAPKTVPAVVAWGFNRNGVPGNGTTTSSSTPVHVKLPAGQQFRTLRSDSFSLAVSASGRVYTWGYNASGELGDGTTTSRLTPRRVRLPAGVKVKTARAGAEFALALTTGGRLLAWGYNVYGELGDGTTTNRETPVFVRLPAGVKVTAATAGVFHALALTRGHKVLAGGDNTYGQLGTGSTTSHHQPVRSGLPTGTKVTALAAGRTCSLVLTAGHHILAWGKNGEGQLGNGTTTDQHLPVRVRLPRGFTPAVIGAGWRADDAMAAGRQASK